MTLRSSAHVVLFAFSALALAISGCGDDSETGSGGAGGSGTQSSTSTDGTGGTAGTGGDGSGGGSTDPKTVFCEGQITRDTECNPDNVDTLDECLVAADTTCLFDGAREGLGEAIGECVNARSCSESDDDCYYQAGLENPAEGQDEFIAACTAALETCSEFPNDYCDVTILEADRYAAMSACLELDCAEIGDCLDTEFQVACPDE